jgi:SNF2 family DNA or RNA helicase
MTCVEDLDRPEPADFKQECDDAFLLTLRPYQRRSLAHMLHEERAAGGSARHLWVQYNLPQNPEIYCYVSPILHQIRCSTSKIEMEQWIGTKGGAGWIALQMGMGKTACAVGAIQMNPPPEGWRANRAYQSLRLRDHLSSIENNMPHGGTLIVMPPTLIDQWEDEIRKTTQVELSILKWTENTKGAPRTLDCKEIAQ